MKEKLKKITGKITRKITYSYKKLPYRKTLTVLFVLVIFYLILWVFARKIETLSTFPAVLVNVQDSVGKVKVELDFEEINITDSKGTRINGLYVNNNAEKTIYYFHGNGGPLSYFYSEIKYLGDLGYNVMAYDYPGYGKSEGYPYEEDVINASEVFWKYLKEKKGLTEENTIVWGYSVGTAVSVQFSEQHKNIDRLVLVSPLASRYDMSEHFLGIPFQRFFFLKNTFVTKELVKDFSFPVLIIHGNADTIVPFSQGKIVFENYLGEKDFIEIDGFGHNFIIDIYGDALQNTIKTFLNGKKLNFENNYLLLDGEKKAELEKEYEEQKKKESFFLSIDLDTDNSIQKFVSAKVPFEQKSYVPEDLVPLSHSHIQNKRLGQRMREEAAKSLENLADDFYEKFKTPLLIVSSYRSYEVQVHIKAGGCSDRFCSKPGYSEHQSGLAVDLFEATNEKEFLSKPHLRKYFEWLNKNASKYGFHNTYQKGLEIDTYEIEPWHWRYLGVPLATYLQEHNMTIAEFYDTYKNNQLWQKETDKEVITR